MTDQNKPTQDEDGGRMGEPRHMGGADKPGHLSPQIDIKDDTSENGGQIAQASQQASGQGSGQT
jgi:hypothetical protein